MSFQTFTNIYDTIKTIASNHRQINTFGEGDTWEIATSGTTNYPMFWAVPQGSMLQKGQVGYKFQFIVMDLVQTGEGNEIAVLSDTHQTLTDVLSKLKWGGYSGIDIRVETFDTQSFTEKFDDMVSGWSVDVTIWTEYNWNSCAAPTINSLAYDSDAVAYFNAVTTPFTAARKTIINTLVLALKASGDWNQLNSLWLFANEAADQGLINLISPTDTAVTNVGSMTFTADQGYTGDGSSSYLNSNLSPTTATKYLLDSASFGVYSRTNLQATMYDMGGTDGTKRNEIIPWHGTDSKFYGSLNSSLYNSLAAADSLALSSVNRDSATNLVTYKRGVVHSTTVTASNALGTRDWYIGAGNISGTASLFSTRQYAMAFVGNGSVNHLTLYNAIQAYMTSLNSQV